MKCLLYTYLAFSISAVRSCVVVSQLVTLYTMGTLVCGTFHVCGLIHDLKVCRIAARRIATQVVHLQAAWFIVRQVFPYDKPDKPMHFPLFAVQRNAAVAFVVLPSQPIMAPIFHDEDSAKDGFRQIHCTAPASHAHKGAASV